MSDRPTGLTGPEPGAELERLRRLPSWLFSKLALRGARLVAELMGSTSLRSDFALLAGLEAFGPLSQAELGRRLGMDRSDVVAVRDQLIQLLHRLLDRDQQQPGRPASACSTPRPEQRPLG